MPVALDIALARRLHRRAGASRWALSPDDFGRALEASATRAFGDSAPRESELSRYLGGLHVEDLALACACAEGHGAAWDHFMATFRPILHRSADALDPTGGARELADALYADLYGLTGRSGERRSLLRSFHGRSSLATWLRSVLAQRQIDRFRSGRRDRPLPEDESPRPLAAPESVEDPERPTHVRLMQEMLARAVAGLPARERLQLRCYYAEGLTLAAIGRLTSEHEATISRRLARSRATIRAEVERLLRVEGGLDKDGLSACFASVVEDAGPLDLDELFGGEAARKKSEPHRSEEEPVP